MAQRWTMDEERKRRSELKRLYVQENKTIGEIAPILDISQTTVYDRIVRFGLPLLRLKKSKSNNRRTDIVIPNQHSAVLAEFVGVLLGDGNLTPTQVTVTLGLKDKYADHVCNLMQSLFHIQPHLLKTNRGHLVVYIGSVELVRWFLAMGLVFNKVQSQVGIPEWIFTKESFMQSALRGLFDTDGSVYRLRWGIQISFCNRSIPLLRDVRQMLISLGYHPSRISGYNLYLTRKVDIDKFCKEVGFANGKHLERLRVFLSDKK